MIVTMSVVVVAVAFCFTICTLVCMLQRGLLVLTMAEAL
jgi:hypothetical protein